MCVIGTNNNSFPIFLFLFFLFYCCFCCLFLSLLWNCCASFSLTLSNCYFFCTFYLFLSLLLRHISFNSFYFTEFVIFLTRFYFLISTTSYILPLFCFVNEFKRRPCNILFCAQNKKKKKKWEHKQSTLNVQLFIWFAPTKHSNDVVTAIGNHHLKNW